ncbi:diguanylate cyclase [Desulfovibrio sp. DS-1]|nr:diguanylate cyclase [Desulfovibrio sp. DS-1]
MFLPCPRHGLLQARQRHLWTPHCRCGLADGQRDHHAQHPQGRLRRPFGGEEFTVIASHTPAEQVLVLAERIRVDVERTSISHEGHTFTMTVSIGVAPVSASCDSSVAPLDDVISKADCAPYEAKNNDGNRVGQWRAEDATMSCKHTL